MGKLSYNYKNRTCSICGKRIEVFEDCVCNKCKEGVKKKDKVIKEKIERFEKTLPLYDPINHPSHYNSGTIEVLDYIIDKIADPKSYCIGNVLKYVSRYDLKGTPVQDLKKAIFYLNKTVELIEKENDYEN